MECERILGLMVCPYYLPDFQTYANLCRVSQSLHTSLSQPLAISHTYSNHFHLPQPPLSLPYLPIAKQRLQPLTSPHSLALGITAALPSLSPASLHTLTSQLDLYVALRRAGDHFSAWGKENARLVPLFSHTKYRKIVQNTNIYDYLVEDHREIEWTLYTPREGLPVKFRFVGDSAGDRELIEPKCVYEVEFHGELAKRWGVREGLEGVEMVRALAKGMGVEGSLMGRYMLCCCFAPYNLSNYFTVECRVAMGIGLDKLTKEMEDLFLYFAPLD